jgi:hypothetical protein
MKALAVALVLLTGLTGCKVKEHKVKVKTPTSMTEIEVQRGEDACKTYIDKICACAATKPDLAKQCDLAKALPDAMHLSLAVALNPDSKPDVVDQAYGNVKKTISSCFDEVAKLPQAGCQ